MARTSTSWRKGVSGNPRGRPRNAKSREAIRKALLQPAEPGSSETRLERWAEEIINACTDVESRLAVFRFLDGPSPRPGVDGPDDDDREQTLRPRIVIPGLAHPVAPPRDADEPEIKIPGLAPRREDRIGG